MLLHYYTVTTHAARAYAHRGGGAAYQPIAGARFRCRPRFQPSGLLSQPVAGLRACGALYCLWSRLSKASSDIHTYRHIQIRPKLYTTPLRGWSIIRYTHIVSDVGPYMFLSNHSTAAVSASIRHVASLAELIETLVH